MKKNTGKNSIIGTIIAIIVVIAMVNIRKGNKKPENETEKPDEEEEIDDEDYVGILSDDEENVNEKSASAEDKVIEDESEKE